MGGLGRYFSEHWVCSKGSSFNPADCIPSDLDPQWVGTQKFRFDETMKIFDREITCGKAAMIENPAGVLLLIVIAAVVVVVAFVLFSFVFSSFSVFLSFTHQQIFLL